MSDTPSPPSVAKPKKKQGRYYALTGLLIGGILWWIFWGAPAQLPSEILQTGSAIEHPSPDFRPSNLHLSLFSTSHRMSTVFAGSSSTGDRLLASTAAVIAESDQVLAQQFAHEIYHELAKNPRFTKLYYLPPGKHLPVGEELPHLFIHVDQRKLEQTGVLPYRQLDATLSVRVNSPLPAAAIRDGEGPPIPSINWASMVRATTKEIGLETASMRYRNVAQSFAKASVQNIEGHLKQYRDEHGFASALPPGFQPAFTPTPPFAFLDDLGGELLCSGPSFMRSNHSIWRIPAAKSKQALTIIEGKLRAAGWTIQDKHPKRQTTVVQAKRDEAESIDFFPKNTTGYSQDRSEFERPWYLVYARSMSDDQVDTAFRALLTNGASESTITWFERLWPRNQQAVDAYFARHPPKTIAALSYFARKSHREKNVEQARDYLLRADALARLQEGKVRPTGEIEKLAEELSVTDLPPMLDVSTLIAAGLIDMRANDLATHTVGNGDVAIFLLGSTEEKQSFLCLTANRLKQDAVFIEQRALRLEKSGASGSSNATMSMDLSSNKAETLSIHVSAPFGNQNPEPPIVTVRQLSNNQFEFTVKYQRSHSPAAREHEVAI